jgi:hypothetical protein
MTNNFQDFTESTSASMDVVDSTKKNITDNALVPNILYTELTKDEKKVKNLKLRLKLKYINYDVIINSYDMV